LPYSQIEAASVIKFFAIIETKHLLVKVTVKMKRFDRHIRARDAALQQTPEVFESVGVYAAIHVLSCVVNDLVSIVRCQSVIRHERIAVECRASGDMLANFLLQDSLATARNYRRTNLSAALQNAHDSSLVLGTSSGNPALTFGDVHISRFAADEGLVYFDFPAEFGAKEIVLHRKPNALEHEPCRFLGNLHISRNLVAANAVLAVSQHPRCREPLVQRNRGIFVDRPDFDGELALGVVTATLPCSASGMERANLRRPASGTNDAVRPAPDSDVVDTVVGIREVDNRFLKARWFFLHFRSPVTKMYQKPVGESSNLLPLLGISLVWFLILGLFGCRIYPSPSSGPPPALSIATVQDLGVIPTNPDILGRDGGYSALFQGYSVWLYGDTFLAKANAEDQTLISDSWSFTTDLNAQSGITGFQERLDSAGAPTMILPLTPAEQAFNQAHNVNNCQAQPCGARWALWPSSIVVNPSDGSALIFYQSGRKAPILQGGDIRPVKAGSFVAQRIAG